MNYIKNLGFILICLLFITLTIFSTSNVQSSVIDLRVVGYDTSDIDGVDGGANQGAPDTGNFEEGSNNDSSGDNPEGYDPENPYGEWE